MKFSVAAGSSQSDHGFSVLMQEVPQEAYGGRGKSAAITPGKPNHDDMSLNQQERPSSLPVSMNRSK